MFARTVGFALAAVGLVVVVGVWVTVEAPAVADRYDPGAPVQLILQAIGLVAIAMGVQLVRRGTLRFLDRPRRGL